MLKKIGFHFPSLCVKIGDFYLRSMFVSIFCLIACISVFQILFGFKRLLCSIIRQKYGIGVFFLRAVQNRYSLNVNEHLEEKNAVFLRRFVFVLIECDTNEERVIGTF